MSVNDTVTFNTTNSNSVIVNDNAYVIGNIPSQLTQASWSNTFFTNFQYLQNIDLSFNSNITVIHTNCFKNCYKLNRITFSNSLLIISSNSFENCYELSDINIPSSVTSVQEDSFKNCTSLQTITINSPSTILANNSFFSGHNITQYNTYM